MTFWKTVGAVLVAQLIGTLIILVPYVVTIVVLATK